MFTFQQIQILLEDGWHIAEVSNNKWCFQDVAVCLQDNGAITVTSDTTPVFAVKCTAKNDFFTNALVLGDTWERGYADFEWAPMNADKQLPWYFSANENNNTYCFGVQTGPNALCFWQCSEEEISLTLDVRNGSLPLTFHGRVLEACIVVTATYEGDAFDAVCNFCRLLCPNPRTVSRPIFGGNDWYCNYGANTFDNILVHAKRIAECTKDCAYTPYMVIDDGWQIRHHFGGWYNGGPWKECNNKFGDMKKMAEAIEEAGCIPGIWFRPLVTMDACFASFVMKTDANFFVLDPSVPEALELIQSDIATIKSWGYKLIKHDFSTFEIWNRWGGQVTDLLALDNVIFHDKTRTTAEIIKGFYTAIREAAGDNVLVMGCNTMSHLSAGLFELQRTGDDTSGVEWERTRNYGPNTLAFRSPQHQSFYLADADCVGITNEIEWAKNKQWLDVVAKSGTPLFVSIAADAYTEEIKEDLKKAFAINTNCKTISRPLDWMETKIPTRWESECGVDTYNWE